MTKKLVFLSIFIFNISWAQHTINGTFMPPEQFSYVFLYKSTPKGANYVDRSEISSEGKFSITVDSTKPPGIYKLVYALPPEDNNFDIIYSGNEDITVHFDVEKDIDFSLSKENKLWSSYKSSMEAINTTISNFYAKNNQDENAFSSIFMSLKNAQIAFEKTAINNPMALEFIKASKPYIPSQFEDYKTYITNIKTHFLDYLNFESSLLLSSDFLTNKVKAFVFEMANSNPEYKVQINRLVEKINSTETKTAYLELLWQEFVNQDNETLANYITDTYLLDLAKIQNNTNLLNMVSTYKNTSKGALAPNFDLTITQDGVSKNITLHKLDKAKQYLVVFWSSTCGHCLQELPQLETMLNNSIKNDIMVIAIGLEEDSTNWLETIKTLPHFTHVLGLEKWDNPVARSYGINATPSYFLLDENKTIITKPYDIKALKEILNK